MKRFLRILVGVPLSPFPMFLATWTWLFSDGENWLEDVGSTVWYLASGQWEKLPD